MMLQRNCAVKGHNFSRADASKDHDFSRADVLKGHDFSRADTAAKPVGALAPEGSSESAGDLPC